MIVIYTKPGCPRCEEVKAAFREKGVRHEVKTIGVDVTREEVLRQFPDARQLPLCEIRGRTYDCRSLLKERQDA